MLANAFNKRHGRFRYHFNLLKSLYRTVLSGWEGVADTLILFLPVCENRPLQGSKSVRLRLKPFLGAASSAAEIFITTPLEKYFSRLTAQKEKKKNDIIKQSKLNTELGVL